MRNSNFFFSGELPPNSLNGISYSNACLLKHLKQRFNITLDTEVVDLKYHNKINVFKIVKFISRLFYVILTSYRQKFSFFYIVFSNSFFGSVKTLLIILFFKLFNKKSKVIIHFHRGDLKIQLQRSILLKVIFKLTLIFSNKLIVLSDKVNEYLVSNFNYNIDDIICLENTVYNEVYLDKCENTSDSLNCIFISNYIEEKGILVLLEAFKILGSKYKLKCYGNFTDANLKNVIDRYKSDNISINGPIVDFDKFDAISKSDLLILPSYNEGKPVILLESMMLGTPFIATKVGYIEEMVDLNYPFLMSEISANYLAQFIIRYFSLSIIDRNELSIKLKERYVLNYSNSIYFEKINLIFND